MQRALCRFSGTAMTHKHDLDGKVTGPYCVYIGTVIYVYTALHCTCGTLREFKIRGKVNVTSGD